MFDVARTTYPYSVTLGNPTPALVRRGAANLTVFFSHASADVVSAQLVERHLNDIGVTVYLAEHDPRPGTSVAKKVQDNIKQADLVVVLLSARGANSVYVHQEIGYAIRDNKIVIPIVDRAVDRSVLGMLDGMEWIDVELQDPVATMAALHEQLTPFMNRQVNAKQWAEVEKLVGLVLLVGAIYLFGRSSTA